MIKTGLLILAVLFLCSAGEARAAEFTVKTVSETPDITVMEVDGNYDANLPDGSSNDSPRQEIAREFYRNHPDRYDFLVIFSNFSFAMLDDETEAFYSSVKNDISGLGSGLFDNSSLFGSRGKLQGLIDMGNLAVKESDPLAPGFSKTMGILSHELLHRWSARTAFIDETGAESDALLGRRASHWSFLLDTAGSLEYGNRWLDNGDGTFTSLPGFKYFSPLDLYLMGLIGKDDVPSMLLIDSPGIDPTRLPEAGVTVNGSARRISIDQIIAAEGERSPGPDASQRTFNIGCIYITRPGTYNRQELEKIKTVLGNWEIWFSSLTNSRAQLITGITLPVSLPDNPGPVPVSTSERTVPPEINDGIAWLLDRQQEDGSWQDSLPTKVRDTAEALQTLSKFPGNQTPLSSGADYLVATPANSHDYRTRTVEALGIGGHDVAMKIEDLAKAQNGDGGWGGKDDYYSNALDTSMVLHTLTDRGFTDPAVIGKAIAFLNSQVQVSGGWGKEDGKTDILTTARVVTAYALLRESYPLEQPLTDACLWLQDRQNPDGGFGERTTTVYETAITMLALKTALGGGEEITTAIDYLYSRQAADGSWNGMVYDTALALKALWTMLRDPDLRVASEDIKLTPETFSTLPTTASIEALISNNGLQDVAEVKVALYEKNTGVGNQIAEQTISLAGNSSAKIQFTRLITDGETHRFIVVADPGNRVAESSEANNIAMKWLYPESSYDLEIRPNDLKASPDAVDFLQTSALSATVSNHGTVNAFNVPVRFFLDNGSAQYDITTRNIDVPAGASATASYSWPADHPGDSQNLTVAADPFDAFTELNENNNQATRPITVRQNTWANLKILPGDLAVSPNPALEANDALITAIVSNNGFASAENFTIEFFSSKPDSSDKHTLGREIIAILAPGETLDVKHTWPLVGDTEDRVISVVVDPENLIDEVTVDDNQTFIPLNILTLPDPAISVNSIALSPGYPKAGDPLTVSITIQNNGGQEVVELPVTLDFDGVPTQTAVVAAITANSEALLDLELSAEQISNGIHTLRITLDPNNQLLERSEANNLVEKEFGVQNSDLWLTERYFSPNGDGVKDTTSLFFRLQQQQTVKVAITDSDGAIIRLFSYLDLSNILSGHITWDGRNDRGTIAPDGDYRIILLDEQGIPLAGLTATLDTNRSSILDAVGTAYLLQNNISCMLPNFTGKEWVKNDTGLVISINRPNPNTPSYPTGLYKVSPDGEDVTRLIPLEWGSGIDPTRDYLVSEYDVSRAHSTIAFVLETDLFNPVRGRMEFSANQLWTVDQYGENLTLIAENDPVITGHQVTYHQPYWSPDGNYLSYMASSSPGNGDEGLWIIRWDGSEPDRFFPIDNSFIYVAPESWSPDGAKFAYWAFQDSNAVSYTLKTISLSDGTISETPSEITDWNIQFTWLDNDRIIAGEDNWRNSRIWLFDTDGVNPPALISDLQTGELAVNPAGPNFAFVDFYQNGWDMTWTLQLCDDRLQCRELSLNDGKCYECDSMISDLQWSPDGRRLAFIDWTQNGTSERYFPANIVVMDPDNPEDRETYSISGTDIYKDINLQWYGDNISLLGITGNGIFVIDTLKKTQGYITVEETLISPELAVSPSGNHLTYKAAVSPASICYDTGDVDLWAASSLLNLTADLRAIKKNDFIELKGIASDLNFSSYKLEYADVNRPEEWLPVTPPSDFMAINDTLAQWIPSGKGIYYVRLTVTDKAGNIKQNRIKVTWGFTPSISGIYLKNGLFSPNGDEVKDSTEIHYQVMAPVHLEVTVLDEYDRFITSFHREYTQPPGIDGADYVAWDGRDNSNVIVPDGMYKIRIQGLEFPVEVDNTPPVVSLEINQTDCGKGNEGVPKACVEPFISITAKYNDLNIASWIIESGEGNNPSDWFEESSTSSSIRYTGESITRLANKKFRLTVADKAGNYTSTTSEKIRGILYIQGWRKKDETGQLLDYWLTRLKYLYRDGMFREDDKYVPEIALPDSSPGRSEMQILETQLSGLI